MADNVTPVKLEVKDFEAREVILVDYKFNQTTDIEGQISGIPRGGKVTIRVKAMNDGNNQLLQWMLAPNDPRDMKITFENTIDGKVKYEIPEGTQSGTVFRLRGKGIPVLNGRSRGDQYVTVTIETPKGLNKEQKEALRKFSDLLGENNYEKRKGFFGKKK